jgi:hypothetical protein
MTDIDLKDYIQKCLDVPALRPSFLERVEKAKEQLIQTALSSSDSVSFMLPVVHLQNGFDGS